MPDTPDSHSPDMPRRGEQTPAAPNEHPGGTPARSSRLESVPILDQAERVTVQISLLREQYEAMLRIIAANEWERDEGLLMVLMSGLGYLDATLRVEGMNRISDKGRLEQELENLVKDLASYHSMYAVMKYNAFKLYKVNQTLEFNISGLRATERMWEEWADRMRREQADLRAEVLRLRSLMSEFTIQTRSPEDGSIVERPLDEVLPTIIPALQPKPPVDAPAPPAEQPQAQVEASEPPPRPSFWKRLFRRGQ